VTGLSQPETNEPAGSDGCVGAVFSIFGMNGVAMLYVHMFGNQWRRYSYSSKQTDVCFCVGYILYLPVYTVRCCGSLQTRGRILRERSFRAIVHIFRSLCKEVA
jgi:hypothetical protein